VCLSFQRFDRKSGSFPPPHLPLPPSLPITTPRTAHGYGSYGRVPGKVTFDLLCFCFFLFSFLFLFVSLAMFGFVSCWFPYPVTARHCPTIRTFSVRVII
jgi:hypothetical protein